MATINGNDNSNDSLVGTTGDDSLSGLGGNDTLFGDAGNDTLRGGLGDNVIDGGGGTDFAIVDFSDRVSAVSLINGAVPGFVYPATVGGVAAGSVTNIETISITGGSGNDTLGAVLTTATQPGGAFIGGSGNDVIVIDASGLTNQFSGGLNVSGLYLDGNGSPFVTFSGFEVLHFTGNTRSGAGGSGVNGGAGDDILTGLGGDDSFGGGQGDNIIDGGGGNDAASFDFSNRIGNIDFINGAVPGVVYTATVGGVFAGSVTNVETISITGGSGNDTLGTVLTTATQSGGAFVGGSGSDVIDIDASGLTNQFSGGLNVSGLYLDGNGSPFVTFSGFEVLHFTGNTRSGAGGSGVNGGAGDDILTGLGGDDSFGGGQGDNIIDGGGGNDAASFDFSNRIGNIDFINGAVPGVVYTATVGGVFAGSVTNVETISITGGSGNDTLGTVLTTATQSGGAFVGGSGSDVIDIDASGLTNQFSGGLNVSGLYLDGNGSPFVTFSGFEVLHFTGNTRSGAGGSGVNGGAGDDILTGLGGDDSFGGGQGDNIIDGGGGNDAASFDFSNRIGNIDFINGAVPGVVYTATVGGVFAGSVTNVETISITGGSGNDTLGTVLTTATQSGGAFVGGSGSDVIDIDASGLTNQFSGGLNVSGLYLDGNGSPFVTFSGFEVLHFTGNTRSGPGGSGVNGGTGDDILTGLGGDDSFGGGQGNNIIDGGGGNDAASFDFSNRAQSVQFVNGAVTGVTYAALVGGIASGSVTNVETISITGGSADDRLGAVLTIEHAGAAFIGGSGNDTMVVDASALPDGFSGGINTSGLYENSNGSPFVTFSGFEALEFTGNAVSGPGGPGITGGSGNDSLTGLAGNDFFSGATGNDLIIGAAGNDSLSGGDGNDRIQGDAGNDSLSGGNDNDTLVDDFGANSLSGDAGNDVFAEVGNGSGADSLTGGTGTDTYVLNVSLSQAITVDQVTDFLPGAGGDVINLFQIAGQLSGFTAGSDPIATGYARFVQSGADALFQIDADGSAGGAQFVTALNLQGKGATVGSFTSANISLADPAIAPLAPRAGLDTGFDTTEDSTTNISVATLLANDHSLSVQGQGLTFLGLSSATSTGGASLTVNGGTITYDPGQAFQYLRAGEVVTDSFSYRIADDANTQATGDVYVTVTGVNDPPTANDDGFFAALGVQTNNLYSSLLANDTDPDQGDTLTIISVNSLASRGTVTFDAPNHSILYQASGPNFDPFAPGTDSFSYTIQDGSGAQSTGTATIFLTPEPLSFSVASVTAPTQLTDLSTIPIDYEIDHAGLAGHDGTLTVDVFLSQDSVFDATDHQVGTQSFALSDIGAADGTFDGEFVLPPSVLGNVPFGTYHFLAHATLTLTDSSVTPESDAASGAALFSPSYSAHVNVAGNTFVGGDSVPMSGTAISTADGTPVAFADVTVTVTHNGVSQNFSAKTDAFGAFTFDYPSFDGMAGTFQVDAHHPGFAGEDAAPEDSFSLVDLDIAQSLVSLGVASGTATPGTLTLSNPSDQALNNLGADVSALPAGWDFTISDLPATLAAHASTPLHYTLTTPAGQDSENFDVSIHSSEGAADSVHFDVDASPVAANLTLDDAALMTGVMVGGQKLVELTIHNVGQQTATGVNIQLPGLAWLNLAGNANLGDIAGGDTKTIGLLLDPPDDTLLGHHFGQIFVNYDGSQTSVADFNFNATTDAIGGLHLDLTDEATFFSLGSPPPVHGATVRLYDATSGALVSRFANVEGSLDVPSLAVGIYKLQVSAPDHISYNSTVAIEAGSVHDVEAFLPMDGVTYSWSVEETTLEDRYHIELDSTFKTDVPVPIVTMDPPILQYADLAPGQSKVIDLTITNLGFIQVDNIGLDLPDPTGFVITPLIDHIDVLGAKQSKVVPVTIERLPIGQPQPPPPPGPDGPPLLPYDPTFCADSGHSSGTLSYHYECGPDGVWRLVPEGYDGPDSSSPPCLPGQGGAFVTGAGSPAGTGIGSGTGGVGGSGGGGGGTGNGTGGHSGPQFGYIPNPQDTDQPVRCDASSPGGPGDEPNCLVPLGIKILGGLAIGLLAPEGLAGVAVAVAAGAAVDAAADYFGAGGGDAGKAAALGGALGHLMDGATDATKEGVQDHLADLGGGFGSAANGLLKNVAKGIELGNTLADLLKCLSQLNSTGGALTALDMGGDGPALFAQLTSDPVSGTSDPTDLASIEAALMPLLGPRFDGLAQVDDLVHRLLTYSDFRAYMVGDLRWFDTHDGNGLVNFLDYIGQAYQNLVPITDPSTVPVPNDVDPSLLGEFVTRYNNTVQNWNNGIFRAQDVPAGGPTDFVDANTLLNLYQRVAGPADAPQSVHDAIAAYDQQLLANVGEAQNELQIEQQQQVQGTCATIHLRIEQDVVMSRQAFVGSFAMETNNDDLSNIQLNIVITDDNGNFIATNVFGVTNDFLDGIGHLDGTDGLSAHHSLSSEYTFLPSSLAAPEGPTQYHIGGTLSFHDVTDDHDHFVDLDPVTINVLPQAELTLDYFQQRDVVADDPFTDDIVEPSEPFVLGVLLSNDGKGAAHDLRIESAQPEIIDNKKGLLIDFQIVGSKVDGDSPSGSLTAVFGDIGPDQTASGAWFLESTLQGKFLDYKATFSHTDALGLPELSLIKAVNIHELIHGGDFDGDSRIDFLANDDSDGGLFDLPDHVYFADGTKFAVAQGDGTAQIASQTPDHITVTLSTVAGSGWENFDVASPVDQNFRLTGVTRSDASTLFSGQYWFTDRTFDNFHTSPTYENRIHILDDHAGTSYTIAFDRITASNQGTSDDDILQGTPDNDLLIGLAGNDELHGLAGNDALYGDESVPGSAVAGNDSMEGGAGDDSIDGGDGTDTALFSGAFADYAISLNNGVYTLTDTRSGSPDGSDQVTNVENFQFSDGTLSAAQLLGGDTPPTAVNDVGSATEAGGIDNGTAGSDATGNVLGNDTDPDSGDTITVAGVASGSAAGPLNAGVDATIDGDFGSLVLHANGDFDYTVDDANPSVEALNASAHLSDVFTYTMQDISGASSTATLTVTVHGADDAPSVPVHDDLADNSVVEGASNGATVGITAAATDIDGGPLVYSLSDDAGGRFSIDPASGVVTVADGTLLNYEDDTSHTITVDVSDGTLTRSQNFVIDVVNVAPSEPVESDNAANSVSEDAAHGDTVGVTASSADPSGGTVHFSLTADSSGGGFTIDDATGVVTVDDASKIDFESSGGSYQITVQASDTLLSRSHDFTIQVADVAPSQPIDDDAADNVVSEDVANGASVGVTASSSDIHGGTVAYSITADSSGGGFGVDASNGVVTVADKTKIDYESAAGHAYSITVTASDGTKSSSQSYNIAVTDVAPSKPADSNAALDRVAENSANGTLVGITASSTDVNGGTVTYALTDDADGRFTIDTSTGAVKVANGSLLDYEAATSHNITVVASDPSGALSATQTFTIAIIDVPGVTIAGTSRADLIDATHAPGGQPLPSPEDDTINGGGGNDSISGLAGNDTIDGGGGSDRMTGGAGNDVYVVDATGDVVVENPNEGIDTVHAAVKYTLGANVENLTLTGAANVAGSGNALDNVIVGNSGSNVLAGLAGADSMDGGAGTDTATYAASAAGVSASLATGTGSGGDAQGDSFANVENLTGSNFADVLEGNGGNNVLNGGAGIDTASYEHALAAVIVSLALTGAQNTSGAGTDTLTNFENLTGSGFGDALTGSSSANVLMGLDGNDSIMGGGGADMLTGGLGADHFVFASTNESNTKATDTIADFTPGDLIDLSAIDADTKIKGDQNFTFGGNNAAVVAHAITWSESGGNTVIQGDVNGGGGAEFVLVLSGINHGLIGTDFIL